jgi:hypothetical protein
MERRISGMNAVLVGEPDAEIVALESELRSAQLAGDVNVLDKLIAMNCSSPARMDQSAPRRRTSPLIGPAPFDFAPTNRKSCEFAEWARMSRLLRSARD